MKNNIGSMSVLIGGIVGTVAEHINLMREEGNSDRCIDYFIGHAISRALDGQTPGPASVPIREVA